MNMESAGNDFGAKLDQLLSNPAMLAQIKALADTMTGAGTASSATEQAGVIQSQPPTPEAEKSLTPQGIAQPSTAFTERNLRQTRALLLALKPFLDSRRGEKIDKMLGMMRLAEMAGYFKNFL